MDMAASVVHCIPVDDDGFLQAAALCSAFADGNTDDEPPVVLGHDLNGRQALALVHSLETAGRKVRVVLLALSILNVADADDAATFVAYAVRQWGTRMVQRSDGGAMLGPPLQARRGARTVRCAVLGLALCVTGTMSVVPQDFHSVSLRTPARASYTVHIMAQELAQPELLPVLVAAQTQWR
ncbi:MAG: hypothetical protein ACKPKO_55300, partial [Candidatus Fonsibacter sp.]